MDITGEIVKYLGIGVSGVLALIKGFAFVKEGELGSKTVFGKAIRTSDGKIKIVKTGLVLLIPFVNTMQKAHIRMDTVSLENLNVTLKNGLSYHYSAFVAYHVSHTPDDLEKFLYQVETPHDAITFKLSSSIREILAKRFDYNDVDITKVNTELENGLKEYLLEKIGVTLDSCGLTSFTESVQAQQVSVTRAKIALAKSLYKNDIPISVIAASFGAMPTAPGNDLIKEIHFKEKDEDDEKDIVTSKN